MDIIIGFQQAPDLGQVRSRGRALARQSTCLLRAFAMVPMHHSMVCLWSSSCASATLQWYILMVSGSYAPCSLVMVSPGQGISHNQQVGHAPYLIIPSFVPSFVPSYVPSYLRGYEGTFVRTFVPSRGTSRYLRTKVF